MMDVADIGGAAMAGRMSVPAPTDVTADEEDMDTAEEPEEFKAVDMPAPTNQNVARSLAPGAVAAHPEAHPAKNFNVDSEGRIIVPKGKILSKPKHEASCGDVRKDNVVTEVRSPQSREEITRQLDALLEEEEADAAAPAQPQQVVARADNGVPVIEVVFHTVVGAIVGYYHKVVRAGQWLILISDTTKAASQKFIPKQDPEGKVTMQLTITGADRQSYTLAVVPLGMQFTVDNQDFCVLAIEEEAGA